MAVDGGGSTGRTAGEPLAGEGGGCFSARHGGGDGGGFSLKWRFSGGARPLLGSTKNAKYLWPSNFTGRSISNEMSFLLKLVV